MAMYIASPLGYQQIFQQQLYRPGDSGMIYSKYWKKQYVNQYYTQKSCLLWNPPVALWKLPCLWGVTFLLLLEFFVFDFWQFNSYVSWCSLFYFFLSSAYLGDRWALWTWMCISLPRFGKFSTIIIFNRLSGPFFLSSLRNFHNEHLVSFDGIRWVFRSFFTLFLFVPLTGQFWITHLLV